MMYHNTIRQSLCLQSFRAFALLLVCALLDGALAQPPGRGSGDRGPGRGDMMQRIDKNGDGVIQPEEVPEFARPFFRRAAERRGLDPNKPIPIDRLLQPEEGSSKDGNDQRSKDGNDQRSKDGNDQRSNNEDDRRSRWGRGGRGDWGRGRGEDRRTYKPDNEPAQVRGFGEEPLYPPVPGFDVPLSVTAGGGQSEAELEAMYGSRVTGYVDRDILGRYDKNDNGLLDPEEWQGVHWDSDPNDSDTNNDGRLTRAELIVRMAKRWDVKPQQIDANRVDPNQGDKKKDASEKGRKATSNDHRGEKSDAEKYHEYARSMIRQYDKNKDGVLQKDERLEMRGPATGADDNGDGKITQDEIVTYLANQTKSRRSNERTDRTRPSQSSGDAPTHGMIRFRTPHERLPDGLPDWFRDRDRNLDGQVSMREFTSNWSDSKIAEFEKYDANGDGMMTPLEALLAD